MTSPEDTGQEEEFRPTFTGTEREREWITASLSDFYFDRWFTDVLYRVKAGKEATVYCCQGHPDTGSDLIAAKVYRPRMFRAMRNDWFYKQGRALRDPEGKSLHDGRSIRAIKRQTRFGRRIDMATWSLHEFEALRDLHAAGADVPRPLAYGHNAILMEYVGDATMAAPILHRISPPPDEARRLFERLIRNVEIMLGEYRIHADLSAYNVLYWEGDIRIIDLPQAIDPQTHPQAYELLGRTARPVSACRRSAVACLLASLLFLNPQSEIRNPKSPNRQSPMAPSRFRYARVYGQAAMHIPQRSWWVSRPSLIRPMACSQARAFHRSSRAMPARQLLPEQASPGQTSTQSVQLPQRDSSTGVPAGSGASVRIEHHRTAEPYRSVTARSHLPIHARPDSVAGVLCWKGADRFTGSKPIIVAARARAR